MSIATAETPASIPLEELTSQNWMSGDPYDDANHWEDYLQGDYATSPQTKGQVKQANSDKKHRAA